MLSEEGPGNSAEYFSSEGRTIRRERVGLFNVRRQMQNISVHVLAIVGTLIASLITAAVAFVSLTLTKEQKTSEFRQAWIDGLRSDLVRFLAAARAFARAVEILHTFGADYKGKTFLRLSDDKVGDLRYQVAEAFCTIQLRLNADEPEHKELLRLLKCALNEQNEILQSGGGIEATMKAIDEAAKYAQPVLKKEWERVKTGELPFRIARNWIAPGIVLVSTFFIGYALIGTFKA